MTEPRVLILGGTEEARVLASILTDQGIAQPVTSLAGATLNPAKVAGEVYSGGAGGIVGLTRHLRERRYAAVIDATHPFAVQISNNAAIACDAAGIERLVLTRMPWVPRPGDHWIEARDEEDAVAILKEMALPHNAVVFLALGARRISPFSTLRDMRILLRTVDPIEQPFPSCTVLNGRGPFSRDEEIALFTTCGVNVLVSRNSGGSGKGKLDAARALGIPVVIIRRPPTIRGTIVTEIEQAVNWITEKVENAG